MIYPADITINVGFISLIFHVTYYFIFMLHFSTTQKKTEQQYLVIISSHHAQASEPQVDSRDQLIVVS